MRFSALILTLVLCLCAAAAAQQELNFGHVDVPRISTEPKLSDFLSMKPSSEWAGRLAMEDKFIQRVPKDGAPVSQRTEAYLGYDDKNFYAIFICYDNNPAGIRARMARREDIFDDDYVEVMLDTFHDHRHAYAFIVNPLGIQADAIWTEGQGFDASFDTLWYTEGKRTPQGYVVKIVIPFRSLRFPSNGPQTWGILLNRGIPRNNGEDTFWPQYTQRIAGRLNQEGAASGLRDISPGRNLQFIPYASERTFRGLDLRDPANPGYSRRDFSGDFGLDSKFVIKDKFVFDTTINPDFSQVESDDPQVTVNQRFALFFPEKRPFFQENANYFQTPIDLVFTRNIADPDYGIRMTSKTGPWALGFLVANDASPGKSVPDNDPLHDKKANFYIARVNRDIGTQSTLGVIYTDREFQDSFNRVGGIDGLIRFHQNWTMNFQGVESSTQFLGGPYIAGPAWYWNLNRSGRSFNYNLTFNDASPGFFTETGFYPQTDIRSGDMFMQYLFHTEGKHLVSWGPDMEVFQNYDHNGTRLNYGYFPHIFFEFPRQTTIGALWAAEGEGLRPGDVPFLNHTRQYRRTTREVSFDSNWFKQVGIHVDYRWGSRINLVGPVNTEPELAKRDSATASVILRPVDRLNVTNSYIMFHLRDPLTLHNIFDNHIIRSKWNLQWNRELSFRFIGQYNTVLTNPLYSRLPTTKNFNADFLVTYLLHPGTAFYVGYNSNFDNYTRDLELDPATGGLLNTRRQFINDGKIFFVKVSWLFRY